MNGHGYYAHQGETVVGSFRIPTWCLAARSEVSAGLLVSVIVGAEMRSRENTIATEVSLKRWAAYQAAIEQCLAGGNICTNKWCVTRRLLTVCGWKPRHSWPRGKVPEPKPCSSSFMPTPTVGHAEAGCPDAHRRAERVWAGVVCADRQRAATPERAATGLRECGPQTAEALVTP
jgi:hypothetical protein